MPGQLHRSAHRSLAVSYRTRAVCRLWLVHKGMRGRHAELLLSRRGLKFWSWRGSGRWTSTARVLNSEFDEKSFGRIGTDGKAALPGLLSSSQSAAKDQNPDFRPYGVLRPLDGVYIISEWGTRRDRPSVGSLGRSTVQTSASLAHPTRRNSASAARAPRWAAAASSSARRRPHRWLVKRSACLCRIRRLPRREIREPACLCSACNRRRQCGRPD
jgi:hypothetical protein